jgi:tetratricopeptide (TPR) repeat protein
MAKFLTAIVLFISALGCFKVQALNDSTLYQQLVEGVHLVEKSDFKNGLDVLQQLKIRALEEKNYETLVLAQLNIGALYFRLSDNEKALNNYFIALDLANQYNQQHLLNSVIITSALFIASTKITPKLSIISLKRWR